MLEQSNIHSVEVLEEAVKVVHFPCSKQGLVQKYGDKNIEFIKGQK